MRILLRLLECLRTKAGEPTEEPYLCVRIEDAEEWITVGPFTMRDGDTVNLHGRTTDLVGNEIVIALGEDDYDPTKYTSGDDRLGGIRLLDGEAAEGADADYVVTNGVGRWVLDLPRAARYGRRDRHYRLHFDVLELEELPDETPSQERFCLELVSLHCHDAQQWKDYVYLKVDGIRMFEPRRMRSGSIAQLGIHVPIFYFSRIQLWEQDDGNRSDFFGEVRLFIDSMNFQFDTDLPMTFHADEGIIGDARYTLTYRVTERSVDCDGNRLGCNFDG